MTSSRSKPDSRLDRRAVRFRLGVSLVAAFILGASFLYAPWVNDGPVICGMRLLTGIPCPACGLTRSFCAMSHGAVGEAASFHLFGPMLYALTVLAIPVALIELRRGRRFEWLASVAFSSRVAWVFAGLFAGYHVTRLALGYASGELFTSMQHSVCGLAWKALVGSSPGLL